jgi:hypothetical protein
VSLLDEILESYGVLSAKEQREFEQVVAEGVKDYLAVPNPGPQTDAYFTEADELFYGGSAGGGKSFALLTIALNEHTVSRVFRRHLKDLEGEGGMVPVLCDEIVGSWDNYRRSDHVWKDSNRAIEFGYFSNAQEAEKYQGRAADFFGFDEITQFSRDLYRFITTWNRSTKPGQRCRIVCTGNPPVTAEGMWVIDHWGPWLDARHPNPALPGELRWFTTIDGEDVEVDKDWRGVDSTGREIVPRSRTFIPAGLKDNPDLADTGYGSTLAALPEPYRSAFADGKFGEALKDDTWQVIPTEWILMAQQRWQRIMAAGGITQPMTSMGVDVGGGGPDKVCLAPLHLTTFAETIVKKGIDCKRPRDVAALIFTHRTHDAQVNIDCTGGWGEGAFEHMESNNIPVVACQFSGGSTKRTRDGKNTFLNKRAEWVWLLREALDPESGDNIALPPGQSIVADLTSYRRKPSERSDVIQIESKEEIRKRLGRSPDEGDAIIIAWGEADAYQREKRPSARLRHLKKAGRAGHQPQVQRGYGKAKGDTTRRR